MSKIGISQAKNQLGRLIDQAELRLEIIITKRGRPIAKLVAVKAKPNIAQAEAAANRIRERAKTLKLSPLDWNEWKIYRDAGRP